MIWIGLFLLKGIESIINDLSKQKPPGSDGIIGKFDQTFKEEIMPILYTVFQRTEAEGILPILFYEVLT